MKTSLYNNLLPLSASFEDKEWRDQEIDRFSLGTIIPAVNIREGIKHYSLEMAIPGYEKDDLVVTVDEDQVMTISSEKIFENKEDGEIHRSEYNFTSFTRSFSVPTEVDVGRITAHCEHGVLLIHLPKSDMEVYPTYRIIPIH